MIAKYMRLSVEEKLMEDESSSIKNQRKIIDKYIKNDKILNGKDVKEYIDDGFSGTNTNRPAFKEMINDAKYGEIKTIIVKDLSRFMRNYIEAGDYIENVFPFLGIRFIAINDGFDNEKCFNGIEIDVKFKNLLHDFYCKDISAKVKSSIAVLKNNNKNVNWSPPYGYVKDVNNKFKIVVDDKTAYIVKKIYEMYVDGVSVKNIKKILMDNNYITPAQRKFELYKMNYNKYNNSDWTEEAIRTILKDETYTGTFCYDKYVKNKIVGEKSKKKAQKNLWKRVFNSHEAIIGKDLFEKANEILNSRKLCCSNSSKKLKKNVLQGRVRCKNCNRIMNYREREYKRKEGITLSKKFTCLHCRGNGIKVPILDLKEVEASVLNVLNNLNIKECGSDNNFDELKEIENRLKKLENNRIEIFDRYKFDEIIKEEFLEIKKNINEDILILSNRKKEIITKNEINGCKCEVNIISEEILDKFIENIWVCSDGKVEIVLKNNIV